MACTIGPGPGAYMLPSLVGYERHDTRKQRLPQYSFGLRTQLNDRCLGPGPGAYNVNKMTRYGVSRANEFTMAPRTNLPGGKCVGPGPGAHEVHLRPIYKGVNAPAYSMAGRARAAVGSCAPGPNAYAVDVKPIKPGAPAYSMGLRTGKKNDCVSPGPAAYGAGDLNVRLPRSPQYSMTPRNQYGRKCVGPGPNNYNLAYYRPGRNGQSYSFGIRHSPYSPPMVVKCDNM